MGRVQRISAEAGQWVYGKSEVPGIHSAAPKGRCVYHSVHRSPCLWSHSEGNHLVHDVTVKERQADSLL